MVKPLVSIIIRTCGRPQILKRALESVRKQTYSNVEVIIVEDGKNVSEEFIKNNFSDLNYYYSYTGERQGRCKVGNLGLEQANGKYCNFLDDDDLLLPHHVQTLVSNLIESEVDAVYAIAEEHQILRKEDEFIVKRKFVRYRQPFNRLLLFYRNYIPIQSIMFDRKLFLEYGGIDESLDWMEDWDLWVRYAMHSDFGYIPEVTSIYHTPYKGLGKQSRHSKMRQSEVILIKKFQKYQQILTVYQVNRDMDYIINVYNKKGFLIYMRKIRDFLLFKDF